MFNINFYSFAKDENSTKRPSGSPDTLPCQIKHGSGLISPTIELNIGLATAPIWNYCYIDDFKRYYFIEEWTFEDGFWIGQLQVDVLATYKGTIGDSSVYALRAANLWDGRIVDGYYPAKTGCTYQRVDINPNPWTSPTQGVFVIGAVSKDPEYGAINYYIMDQASFAQLIDALNDDAIIGQWSAIEKSVIDPFQYIKSCVYLPIPIQEGFPADIVPELKIWQWRVPLTTPAVALKLRKSTPYITPLNIDMTIPKHPQATARGNFLNQSPFSIYTLSVPPFGVIDLDTTVLNNATQLHVTVTLDLPTGLGILSVYADNGGELYLMNRLEAKIGVEVVLSQVTRDYVGGANAILSGIGAVAAAVATIAFPPAGLAMGAVVAGAALTAVPQAGNAIGNGLSALTPRAQTIGSGGSYSQLYTQDGLYAQFFEIVDDDITKNGRPCCQVIQPKNVGGYLLIQDGDISMGGTHQEAQMVKAYLESGFYWE